MSTLASRSFQLVLFVSLIAGHSQAQLIHHQDSWNYKATALTTTSALTMDQDGNVFIVGGFSGSADLGIGTSNVFNAGASQDAFLTKINADRSYAWTITFGGTQDVVAFGVATDSGGGIFVSGQFSGTVDFDPDPVFVDSHTAASSPYMFLTRINSDGSYGWTHSIGGAASTNGVTASSVVVHQSGAVFVSGRWDGTVDFDPTTGNEIYTSPGGKDDFFISRYQTNGNYHWTLPVGWADDEYVADLALSSSSTLYAVGAFKSSGVNFDPFGSGTNVSAQGNHDCFIAEYDFNRKLQWLHTIGSAASACTADAAAVDKEGLLIVGGDFGGSIDFSSGSGTHNATANGNVDAFVMKFGPTHNIEWLKTFGGTQVDSINSIDTDRHNNVYASGSFGNLVDFDPGPETDTRYSHSTDMYVSAYSSDGTYLQTVATEASASGSNSAYDGSITVSDSGLLYIGADYKGAVDFEWGPNTTMLTTTAIIDSSLTLCELDLDGDGINDEDEGSVGTDPDSADTDGDRVYDGQEILDGSAALDRGSFIPVIETPVCAEWNGFLGGMWNIVEHVNMSASKLEFTSTVYDINGTSAGTTTFGVQPGQQQDLLVHGLSGWAYNTYGKVCSSCPTANPGDLDGRMVYYKPNTAGSYDFAFAMPFSNGLSGRLYVPFNTYQPSLDSADANNLVANWIQITNFDSGSQSGELKFFDMEGSELGSENVTLAGGARRDYSGHQFGANLVGTIEWIPSSSTALFQLRNVRYYYDNPNLVESFYAAFQLEGKIGSGELLTAPLDTTNGSAVVEIANTTSSEIKPRVRMYSSSGSELYSQKVTIPAKGSRHLIADSILQSAQGIVTIDSLTVSSVVATVMQYQRTGSLGIQTLYGVQATEALGTTLRGSYNTFLNQGCRLLLVNPTSGSINTTTSMVRHDGSQPLTGHAETVPAYGLVDYDLCSQDAANGYGVVTVNPASANSIVAHVLRVGENSVYRFPTPLRQ